MNFLARTTQYMKAIFVIIPLICFSRIAVANNTFEVKNIIRSGFDAYKTDGPDAAIKAWIKGSAVETSLEAQSQANLFKQIEAVYGKYAGYDAIKQKDISKHSSITYVCINYDKGPVYASFIVYKTGEKEIITGLNFNTKPEAVLPSCYLSE